MANEWKKPTNPPPPLFLGEKERKLVKQVNDELLERVIGQAITYLPISQEYTNYHSLYGEAIEKCFHPPVRVYALVEFEGIGTVTEKYGLDKSYSITVNFHNKRLTEDQDLQVREGDYVQYGSSFYEIVTLTEERQLFGQVDHLFQLVAKCIRTRKGLVNLKVLPSTSQQSATTNATLTGEVLTTGDPVVPEETPWYAAQIVFEALDPASPTPGILATPIGAGSSINHLFGIPDETELDANTIMIFVNGIFQMMTDVVGVGDFYLNEHHKIISGGGILAGSSLVVVFLSALARS
jgi:hypothetical protein